MKSRDIKALSRRRFLKGAFGATLGLPLLESVGSGPALAQTVNGPRAFLNFHCSSGVETDRFWPNVGALNASSFNNRGMAALAPYASRTLIPRGVHGYPVGTWTGHLEGTCQALTAAPLRNSLANARSIDQMIAQQLSAKEALVLKPGARDRGVTGFNSISYVGPGQLAAAESDPTRAYRGMVGLSSAPVEDPSAAAAQRLALRRQSVIDLVRPEFEELSRLNLSASDNERLNQHFQLFRDVEIQLSDAQVVQCELDAVNDSLLGTLSPDAVEANENFPLSARLHVQIAALALACGYSQSVVLQWGAAVAGSPMYQWDGMNHQYRHHPLSHGTTGDNGGSNVAGYRDMLYAIDRWNIAEFKQLLDLLDSYPEADGRTLLDNIVVFYTNEFSHGQGHTTGDLPLAIIGGGGYFKLGQSIVVNGSRADIAGERTGNSNRLLATVLASLGVEQDGFSDGPAQEFTELLS